MGVDQTSLDRIRNATFPTARRGYDKQEVEKFLARLADWLATGAGDESRSDTVKRELERVGQRTGAILAQAEDSAQQIRAEAEEEAREAISNATAAAEKARSEADSYASETRSSADSYAEEARRTAEQDANAARIRSDEEATQTTEAAEAQARRIVDEGTQRREDIEAVIEDLLRRRDDLLADTEELTSRLTAIVAEHRAREGADHFTRPAELDPLAREGEVEVDGAEFEDDPGTELVQDGPTELAQDAPAEETAEYDRDRSG